MESYMTEKVTIGDYTVDGIEMLDDDTCCLFFEEVEEGNVLVSVVVEYWLDDNTWHFMDNYYEDDGNFINAEETTHLSADDKEECMTFMKSWLEDLKK